MGKFMDLTGQRYGKLTVLQRDENHGRFVHWICKCDCGTVKSFRGGHLRSGATVSCGCHRLKASSEAKIKRNRIEIDGDVAKIHLFNCDKIALIDSEDVDKVKDYCWALNHYGYAWTHLNMNTRMTLHRMILDVNEPKKVVDHINHNTLDNRKCNLRVFNGNTENAQNINPEKSRSSTKLLNIYHTKSGKYLVLYMRFGKKYNVGTFDDIETAQYMLRKSIQENGFIHGGIICTTSINELAHNPKV